MTTNYSYNGDGACVKKSANGVTTYYVGNLYEYTTWKGSSSVSKTTGANSSTQTYYPYGAIKTSSGTPPTDYGFTGQKRDASANLMYYGARYYDSALGRFIQADTIVPSPLRMNCIR